MNLNPANRNIMFNSRMNLGYLLAVMHETAPFVSLYRLSGSSAPVKQDDPVTLPTSFPREGVFTKRYFISCQSLSPAISVYSRFGANKIVFSHLQDVTGSPTISTSVTVKPNSDIYAVSYATSPSVAILDASKQETNAYINLNLNTHSIAISDIQFSPDGNYLAISGGISFDGLRVFNTSDWSVAITLLSGSVQSIPGIQFSPDGNYLAIASQFNDKAYVFNTSDWSRVPLTGSVPNSNVNSVDFSKDGTMMVIVGNTFPYIYRYTTSNWTRMSNLASLPASSCWGVKFSEDGNYMAVGLDQATPYFKVYTYPGFTMLPDPVILPTGLGNDVAFNF